MSRYVSLFITTVIVKTMWQARGKKKNIPISEIGHIVAHVKLAIASFNKDQFELVMQVKRGCEPGLNKLLVMK
jgi:hypothetical protein